MWDFFKKKKKEKLVKKEESVKKGKPILAKEEIGSPLIKKKERKVIPQVLKSPHIAEKPSYLAKQNQYVFKVYPWANKTEIKKAIEKIYGVEVVKIGIINVPPKRRRLRRISGWRKGYKKAIINLKKGQEIEILPK